MKKYYVYILLTVNNTYYCGYTDDVEKRFQAHLEGKGAKYTRANKPIRIVYQKEFDTKSEAMKEEARLKKMKREEKLNFLASFKNKQSTKTNNKQRKRNPDCNRDTKDIKSTINP